MIRSEDALKNHCQGRSGKIEVRPTKSCSTQRDLAMAYTPGVAEPYREIESNPDRVFEYTAKGNLVAVITNGTAVLGLGHIGPLAGKPAMEGRSVLFKRFADIDVFDIELNSTDPDEIIRVVKVLEPTFGGINLADIRTPECFYIDGEMMADTALDPEILNSVYDFNQLKEKANVLIFPSLESGNIAYKLVTRLGGAKAIGPILMGTSKAIHVLQRDCEVEEIVNTASLAVIDAQDRQCAIEEQ